MERQIWPCWLYLDKSCFAEIERLDSAERFDCKEGALSTHSEEDK